MHKLIVYPLSNADSYLIDLNNGKHVLFDFGGQSDEAKKNINLAEAIKEDINWPEKKNIEVVAFTHNDLDHVEGSSKFFYLEHADKYQDDNRVKIDTLWVPAAMILETGDLEEDALILRQEARHRLKNKNGIRVFGRPALLKDWLEENGIKIDEVDHLISDAGTVVPDLTLSDDQIEFFVHSPFAEREGEELKDRNTDSLVMQVTLQAGDNNTYFLTAADTDSEVWGKIVSITRYHENDDRLLWDIQKVAHHCSYKALNKEEKGKDKTTPTENVQWMLDQGKSGSILIITSLPIPSEDTDQPPHKQAYKTYKETADEHKGDVIVTMENPNKDAPKKTIINITELGASLVKKAIIGATHVTTTNKTPRVG